MRIINCKYYRNNDVIFPENCQNLGNCSFEIKIEESYNLIKYVIESYGLDSIFICFNGGKDSTVVLHAFFAVLKSINCAKSGKTQEVLILYLKNDSFEEADDFLNETIQFYGAKLIILDASIGFVESCFQFSRMFPMRSVCFMGSRFVFPY